MATDVKPKAKIMIVEDEVIIGADLMFILEKMGYHICANVNSGEKAIRAAKTHLPDLTIMDIVLAGEMDGIEAAQIIRSRYQIPVVFITAYADEDRLEKAKLTLPFGYILKPFKERDIRITLEMALYVAKNDAKRREIEASLRASEEKYRVLIENADLLISVYDYNGVCLSMNKPLGTIFGGIPDDHMGKSLYDLHAEHADEYLQRVREVIDTGIGGQYEDEIVFPVGKRWLISNVLPVRDADGKIFAAQLISQDFSDLKRMKVALGESEEKFSRVFKSNPAGMAITALEDGRIVNVNESFFRMTGYSRDESIGRTTNELSFWPGSNDRRCFTGILRDKGTIREMEFDFRTRSGEIRSGLFWAEVIPIDGRPHIVTTMLDVTERKKASQALEESEKKYKALVENALEVICVLQNGFAKYINPKGIFLSGYDREELMSRPFIEFLHPEDRELAVQYHRLRLQGKAPQNYLIRLITKEGNLLWLQVSGISVDWEGAPATLNFLNDITETKNAENQLIASEEKYNGLAEAVFEAVFISENGYCIGTNPRASEMFGYTRDELIGIFGTDVIAPESKELVRQNMLSGYEESYKVTAQRKDGSRFPAEIRGKMIMYQGHRVRITVVRDITEEIIVEKGAGKPGRDAEPVANASEINK